eukprot:3149071-Rhodomonas_salina.1
MCVCDAVPACARAGGARGAPRPGSLLLLLSSSSLLPPSPSSLSARRPDASGRWALAGGRGLVERGGGWCREEGAGGERRGLVQRGGGSWREEGAGGERRGLEERGGGSWREEAPRACSTHHPPAPSSPSPLTPPLRPVTHSPSVWPCVWSSTGAGCRRERGARLTYSTPSSPPSATSRLSLPDPPSSPPSALLAARCALL